MRNRRSRLPRWVGRIGSLIGSFVILWFTGKSGAVEALVGYIFPEADSFGAAQVSLVPFLPTDVTASRLNAEAVQILVLKHDKRESQEVTVLTRSPSLTPEPLLVGGIGADPLPRPAEGGLPPNRILLDADLPGESLMVVAAPATEVHRRLDEAGYSYRTPLVVVDPIEGATLAFQTANEVRGLHLFYWMVIIIAVAVCLTASRVRLVIPGRSSRNKRPSMIADVIVN